MKTGKRIKNKPSLAAVRAEFKRTADPARAALLARYFKTGKGEYAQGDRFLGLTVPQMRLIAGKFPELPANGTAALLRSPWHEERFCALLIMIGNFRRGSEKEKGEIYRRYLAGTRFINNWDLVDLTAPAIVGGWLKDKSKKPLFKLAKSELVWERRIAALACFNFINDGKSVTALAVARRLLDDDHDLIHKAVGWMLREAGKRCSEKILLEFLKSNYRRLPRTTLRYAIERFPGKKRKELLAGKF